MHVRKISRVMSSLAWAGLLAVTARPSVADELVTAENAGGTAKYAGVAPGSASKNPLPPAPADAPMLIWTGFQPTPTGSRIFLQTNQAVSYEVREGQPSKSGKSVLTVILRGCRIYMANNQRSIDTRAFATPVQGFSAKQHKGDVELRISLRAKATAAMGTEAGPDGTQFLVLDFPPGKAEEIASPGHGASTSDVLTLSDASEGVMRTSRDEADEQGAPPKKSGAKGGQASGTDGASAALSP